VYSKGGDFIFERNKQKRMLIPMENEREGKEESSKERESTEVLEQRGVDCNRVFHSLRKEKE
jgi:hypothetical protein